VWTPPIALNDVYSGYIVMANAINTSYTTNQLDTRQWLFPNSTLKTELLDLHPGTQYSISVATYSELGNGVDKSDIIWTEVGGKHEIMCTSMFVLR
jgi:hypothetical protein